MHMTDKHRYKERIQGASTPHAQIQGLQEDSQRSTSQSGGQIIALVSSKDLATSCMEIEYIPY